MTAKAPIRSISYRHQTDYLDDPEHRAAIESVLRKELTELGLEPEDEFEEERLPATEGTAFTVALPAMTVLTLRAKP